MRWTGKDIINEFYAGRYAVVFFRGKEIYNPINGAEFMIPTEYMMLQLYLSYMIGDYILKDLLGLEKYSRADTEKSILVAE